MQAFYTLSISIEGKTRVRLKGSNLDISTFLDNDIKDIRDMARLYYGKLWSPETANLFEKIKSKYLSTLKHHRSQYSLYIKGLGLYLLENYIPNEVASVLRRLPIDSVLLLELDDAASMIPWELIHTDRNFLCLDHVICRTKPEEIQSGASFQRKVPMLLIADPTGDLFGAQIEANNIITQVRGSNIRVARYGGEIRKNQYVDLLKSGAYEIIHYSGHSESDIEPGYSHHKFIDGELYGYEIEKLREYKMPTLVFSNSCQSAESSLGYDDSGNTSLAGSYLNAGVKSCIAAIWVVSDIASAYFSSDFYRYIIFGSTLGEALLRSRRSAYKRWGLQDFIWGSYIFYGDPYVKIF